MFLVILQSRIYLTHLSVRLSGVQELCRTCYLLWYLLWKRHMDDRAVFSVITSISRLLEKGTNTWVTHLVLLPLSVHTSLHYVCLGLWQAMVRYCMFPLCPAVFGEPVFLCGSGEAAVPERNPSCPARPRVALPVRGESEERAEPRKVSGLRPSSFTSLSQLLLCCILTNFIFKFHSNLLLKLWLYTIVLLSWLRTLM